MCLRSALPCLHVHSFLRCLYLLPPLFAVMACMWYDLWGASLESFFVLCATALQAPKGQQADEALAALKAEVRCIAATVGTVPTTAKQGLEVAIEHLAAGIKALESEVG